MVWYGLVWFGMVWYGMVWFGLFGLVWLGMVLFGLVWFVSVWFVSVWFGLVRFDNNIINNDYDIQGNLASMLSANSSMQNINGSVPNMHQVDRRHNCHY